MRSLLQHTALLRGAPTVAAILALLLMSVHVMIQADVVELGPVAQRSLALGLLGTSVLLYSLQRSALPRFELPGWTLGLVGLGLIHALIAITGGVVYSPLYPLVFLHLAICFGLLKRKSAALVFTCAIAFELAIYAFSDALSAPILASHLAFTSIFSALFAMLLYREVRNIRHKKQIVVQDALRALEDDAIDFRLHGASIPKLRKKPSDIGVIRRVGSVLAIREGLSDVLELARLSVHADTAMLFLLTPDRGQLKLKGAIAREGEPSIVDRPVPANEGALGAVLKTRRAVNLKPRNGNQGLGYKTRSDIGSFIGVPVAKEGRMLGVLATDRKSLDPFNEADEKVLVTIARHIQRSMEVEQIFGEMDRERYEHERFFEAFSLLNGALSTELFAQRLLESVAGFKPGDFLAVTLYDEAQRAHTVAALKGEVAEKTELLGASFDADDGGLVSMALKTNQPLPLRPLLEQQDRGKVQIFGGELKVPALRAVKVFPLSLRDLPMGALVVGSTRASGEVNEAELRMLETIVAHAATSLANVQMYKRMEMMATTDGLTGLVNHRRFKELLDEALARAERFGRKVSVLMVDADHFKTVNDTYGHPVGDLVLKRIAKILGEEARRTDVVARYGGEEFVLVLDETEHEGAFMVAERIRQRIEREVIQGEFGRVRVTASLGLCTWPEQAKSRQDLLERADQALYDAKRKGRNQVGVYSSSRVQS